MTFIYSRYRPYLRFLDGATSSVYFESRSFSASCPRRRETSMYIYIYKAEQVSGVLGVESSSNNDSPPHRHRLQNEMLQGGFGDFYSIATVACGNAAMVSTVKKSLCSNFWWWPIVPLQAHDRTLFTFFHHTSKYIPFFVCIFASVI